MTMSYFMFCESMDELDPSAPPAAFHLCTARALRPALHASLDYSNQRSIANCQGAPSPQAHEDAYNEHLTRS